MRILLTLNQLENNLRTLTRVLRETLKTALHPDTFAIASSPIRDTAILNSAIHIDQNSSEDAPRTNHLASPSHSRAFAVVDRTSDINIAARELVAARFAFGGSSPYAPDIVLVNEFVKQDFLQAVVDESRKLSSAARIYGDAKGKPSSASRVSSSLETLKKADSSLQTIIQESNAVVLELPTRRAELLQVKTEAPILAVHAIKSLDDAIDFISTGDSAPALAAYHFGNPQVGKYLAQFVDARVSFVNHIPRELLVGPAHPASHTVEPSTRYTVDMFTLPRPAFIQPTTTSTELAGIMAAANASTAQKFLEQALSPLKAMKRKPGGGVGMFFLSFDLSICPLRLANFPKCRLLRARLPHQRRHDPHHHHQRDCCWYYLAGQEWEDSVLGVQDVDLVSQNRVIRGGKVMHVSSHATMIFRQIISSRMGTE
jgi:hypothetical protein